MLLLTGIGTFAMQSSAIDTPEEIAAKQQELLDLIFKTTMTGSNMPNFSYKSWQALGAALNVAHYMLPQYQDPNLTYPEYTVEDYDRAIKNLQDAFDALEPPGIFDRLTYYFNVIMKPIQDLFNKWYPMYFIDGITLC